MPYKNPEDKLQWQRDFYENNKEKMRKFHRDYKRERRQKDPEFVERLRENNKRWYEKNGLEHERNRDKKKRHAQGLMYNHPEKYPLDNKCEFCGGIERLEHGHIDYDYPELYLTVCHGCNCWMEKPIKGGD